MLTQGRLVPRQPRAIKGTTRTELRGENFHHGRYIHRSISIKYMALHRYNIHHERCVYEDIGVFCYLFIHMLVLIVL